MKGDFSRLRFNRDKGYTRVLQQQGRVTLDADWNEQVSIQADLDRKRLDNVIGRCGVPYGDAGFFVTVVDGNGSGYDLTFAAGTIYAAGHCITLDDQVSYGSQPFLQPPPDITRPSADRVDLVYLCVREHHVTYLEEESIREVALGGPDTTTRVQTIWQVRVKEGVAFAGCDENVYAAMAEAGVGAGLLTTIDDAGLHPDENPCVTPVESGYRGLENRLYRVEVHEGGTIAEGASVKWSPYNGAVAFKVREINVSNRVLTLARLGWDQIVTLSPNSWIELISEADELSGRTGAMLQISSGAGAVNDAQRQVTLKNITDISAILTRYATASDVKVRLWAAGPVTLSAGYSTDTNSTEIVLEDGIRVTIGVENIADIFRTGDYWTFTARTITGEVEKITNAAPHGQQYHCCKLALIHWAGGTGTVEDCRPLFPALTEMLQLHYGGGDGQEAMPSEILPGELMVRVSRGEHPVQNVPVIFELQTEGLDGRLFTDADPTGGKRLEISTDANGQVSCRWLLGSDRTRDQRVVAFIDSSDDSRSHQRVSFHANLSIAEQVSYKTPPGCINIGSGVTTVQDALNDLCSIPSDGVSFRPPAECVNIGSGVTTVRGALNALCSITSDGVSYRPPAGCINIGSGVTTVTGALDDLCAIVAGEDDPGFHVVDGFWGDDKDNKIVHDQRISLDEFINGLTIVCDAEPDPTAIKQASVFMTLELPVKDLPGAQISYILAGDVKASDNVIFWSPTAAARQFLTKEIGTVIRGGGVFLARLFLKGDKIWQLGEPKMHLDGNVIDLQGTPNNLLLPSGDGEQGGAFETWFNVAIEVKGLFVVGVLHPATLLGLRTTGSGTSRIEVTNVSAVNLRLRALDIGYPHIQVIRNSGIKGYTVSGILYNDQEARSALDESDFVLGAGFEVSVVADEKLSSTKLPDLIVAGWNKTFGQLEVGFRLSYLSANGIVEILRKSIDDNSPPSIVICDQSLLNILRLDKRTGEPDGMIRSPFFRRV